MLQFHKKKEFITEAFGEGEIGFILEALNGLANINLDQLPRSDEMHPRLQ